MGYTNSRATMKLWDPHTKKLKYCSSTKFGEHNNKFGKGWSPGSKLMLGTNISTLKKLKTDLSDDPFIKDDIFEVNVNFPPRYTPIVIVAQYCEHHNISYTSLSTNHIPCNHAFPDRNRTNFWILRIFRKETTTVQQVLEAIPSQQLAVKFNKLHVITARRDNNIYRTNLQ